MAKLSAGAPYRDLDDDARAELAAIMNTALPLRPRVAGAVFDRAVATPELHRGELPVDAITAPTLVVNAADALLAPHEDAAAFAARLPDARLVGLSAGGHVSIGQSARIREELAAFLA
jgi:pimeloyl-ACP methyl ester carboxylesterase